MTDDMIKLRSLVEKSADADLLRDMIGFAAEKLMALEVGAATGAGNGEKSGLRVTQRNGYRDRDWETRAGTVEPMLSTSLMKHAELGYRDGSSRVRRSTAQRRKSRVATFIRFGTAR